MYSTRFSFPEQPPEQQQQQKQQQQQQQQQQQFGSVYDLSAYGRS